MEEFLCLNIIGFNHFDSSASSYKVAFLDKHSKFRLPPVL